MRSSYVLMTLVTSMALVLSGCGSSKKSRSEGPPVQNDQPSKSEKPADEESDDTTPVGNQPPETKPPVKPNHPSAIPPASPPPKPPVPVEKFGQIVAADQDSIQTKLLNHYCLACHSGAAPQANLNLESLTPYLTGELGANGYRGVLLFPGRGDISTLMLVMARHESYSAMPPTDNGLKIPEVTAQQIDAVTKWIDGLKVSEESGGGIGR